MKKKLELNPSQTIFTCCGTYQAVHAKHFKLLQTCPWSELGTEAGIARSALTASPLPCKAQSKAWLVAQKPALERFPAKHRHLSSSTLSCNRLQGVTQTQSWGPELTSDTSNQHCTCTTVPRSVGPSAQSPPVLIPLTSKQQSLIWLLTILRLWMQAAQAEEFTVYKTRCNLQQAASRALRRKKDRGQV